MIAMMRQKVRTTPETTRHLQIRDLLMQALGCCSGSILMGSRAVEVKLLCSVGVTLDSGNPEKARRVRGIWGGWVSVFLAVLLALFILLSYDYLINRKGMHQR